MNAAPFTEWANSNGVVAEETVSPFQTDKAEAAAQAAAELFAALLTPRRFDVHRPPPPAVPVFRLGDSVIATPGNLSVIQSQAKNGKSAFVGAKIAATMDPTGDCLGVTSANPHGFAVVHFDTEQSPADHHGCVLTPLRRAGRVAPPAWFRSYRVADVPLATRRRMIPFELERAHAEHGGIHSVFLDGVADFTMDPNNPEEAFGFVDELHQLAIRFETVIVAVLHENPGTEQGKTRGHLGSQLERKAETNLRLSKDGEVVTVYSERARHAHIPKDRGPRFQWSDEDGMHVSTVSAGETRQSAKREELEELARAVFAGTPPSIGLAWGKVLEAIASELEIKREGARRHFKALREAGLITKRGEKWNLA